MTDRVESIWKKTEGTWNKLEMYPTAGALPTAGGTMTGDITMGANAIKFGTNDRELKAESENLTYKGQAVPRVVSTYINATTDVNGNLNIQSYRPSGTSIPIGFLGVGMSDTVRYCFMSGGYYMSFGNSGAAWNAWASATITGTLFWLVIG